MISQATAGRARAALILGTMLSALALPAAAGPEADACAALAANPFEAGHETTGVLAQDVDVPAAIAACEAAVRAEPNNAGAKAWLARALYLDDRFEEALPLAEAAAAGGSLLGKNLVGNILTEGSDPDAAVRGFAILEEAATAGYVPALNAVGVAYENGLGVTADPAKAADYYREAGDKGLGVADANLGFLYSTGAGVPEDFDKAFALYQRGAERGDPLSMSNLGYAYEAGEGVEQDYAKAMEWYRKADAEGEPIAASNIGYLYLKGLGVEQDYAEARRWAEKGAAEDDAYGKVLLGQIYEEGLGVPADLERARGFYAEAAAAGDQDAIDALARLDGAPAAAPAQ